MTSADNHQLVPKSISFKFPEEDVAQMYNLMKASKLPAKEAIPGSGWDLGVDLDWLKEQKATFENEFKWADLEKDINKWKHYTVVIEGINIHFIHEPSKNKNAIPLLILHGWPGTFNDFHKIIRQLTNPSDPSSPSFHVVIPSLPGFAKSSYPSRAGFTLVDIARVFNTLMVEALGYNNYGSQGGDWGASVLRVLGAKYSEASPVLHFNMFVTGPVETNTPFTAAENKALERMKDFNSYGRGYFDLQSTKPSTIGYAIGASPLSLLAYIGEKFYAWSDPKHLNVQDLFATVAIYYLTGSFSTSVLIYQQSVGILQNMVSSPDAWKVKSEIGFSLFPYEHSAPPRAYIAAVGNLVQYNEKDYGGHFPALDNPEGLVADIRELFSKHWPA